MSSTLWRRVFLAVYMLVMVAASLWIVGRAFAPGSMVQIHDQEAVMRRRTSNVLTSLTISDPCWPDVTITDQDFLFALGQQMSAIPRVSGQFPGEAPGKITGTMIFADGSQEEFAAGTVLVIGRTVYYSPQSQEELEDIRTTLAAQLYTLQNLATFFAPGYHVTLSDEAGAILLSPEEMGLARRAILEGEQVEDLLEVSQTVGDRPPRYTLTVRDTAGVELLRLGVYANESTQVYDSYHSGQQLLLCFSGELVPLCQGLLAGNDPP